jgi:4-alpha-glucanotransferase
MLILGPPSGTIREQLEHPGSRETEDIPMQYNGNGKWLAERSCETGAATGLSYEYLIRRGKDIRIWEDHLERYLYWNADGPEDMYMVDHFNRPSDPWNALMKKPFTRALRVERNHEGWRDGRSGRFSHAFRVCAPGLQPGETVCVLGDLPALGGWDTGHPVLMHPEGQWWLLRTDLPAGPAVTSYKYGVCGPGAGRFFFYEEGENRTLSITGPGNHQTLVSDNFLRLPGCRWRGAGVAVPVFSLRSRQSVGVGEFLDLKLLTDWAAGNGLKMLQLLPVNDTAATGTWRDSYPYAAISAFALNPVYISLKAIGSLPADHPLEKRFPDIKRRLNLLPDMDYEAVLKFKWQYLEALYEIHKHDFLRAKAFQDFFAEQQDWLEPYAVFCYLRDQHGTADYARFGAYSVFAPEKVSDFASPAHGHFDQIAIHYFVQYHLHLQLMDASAYAHDKGIALKGDIPIGIYRHSVDAWMDPGHFFLSMQAGAPPDAFAVKGQNWGFPTYHWGRMEKSGFRWWKNRLRHLSLYFDVLRLDHILGFFRIWQIPSEAVEGIMGHFNPALPFSLEELQALGIAFRENRFCKPYITSSVLDDLFGNDAPAVKEIFLDETTGGAYVLKPRYDTQRKMAALFDVRQNGWTALPDHWKPGLFDLVSNVLFFSADDQGRSFHPRFGMMHTSSFLVLPVGVQEKLHKLHDDYFYHRQEKFWQQEAMRKLPALKHATDMLVCGEDLGMIPDGVAETMKTMGLLSLEVQRMPKRADLEFTNLPEVPYLSVATPGTHDMSTLRGWWEEDRARTQRFYNQVLGHRGVAPYFCEPDLVAQIINQHLDSPAMWVVVQLQDFLGISAELRRKHPQEERINIPANAQHYWQYRMHITLEQLMEETLFNTCITDMISASGRNGN